MNIKQVLGKYPEGRFYPFQKPPVPSILKANPSGKGNDRIEDDNLSLLATKCLIKGGMIGAPLGVIVGATSGAVLGAFLGGPVGSGLGAVAGGTVGALAGFSIVFKKCTGW